MKGQNNEKYKYKKKKKASLDARVWLMSSSVEILLICEVQNTFGVTSDLPINSEMEEKYTLNEPLF